ncbi:MAG: replication factor C large subunit [Candidatus Methanomethyliaceae archaeon]
MARAEPKGSLVGAKLGAPWSERYKPKTLQELVGNYDSAEELLKWVKESIAGRADKKAALVCGPPGTGKTLAVNLIADALNLELIEMNASDFRTEEAVERVAGGATLQGSLLGKKGKLIFFDELDGISGREDRGGLGAIMRIIKESKYPVVLAANDPWDPRFRQLRDVCQMIKFKRIRAPSIVVRLRRIAQLAGVSVEDEALKKIAEAANGDMRAAVNDLQMLAEGKKILRAADVGRLYSRTQEMGIFDVMKEIFSANTIMEARAAAESASVDLEMLLQWINENIPNQYNDPRERAEAYDWFSKADIFMNRVKRRQMWDLISYAVELAVGGAALARRGPYRFTKYSFPTRIGILSQSKETRGKLMEEYMTLAKELHTSVKKVRTEYLPYIEILDEAGQRPFFRSVGSSRESGG